MISYDEENRIFQLDTQGTSYCIGIVDGGYAAHLYYGEKIGHTDLTYLLRLHDYVWPPSELPDEKTSFFDRLPQEYPVEGLGDYREPCLMLRSQRGLISPELLVTGWQIGKRKAKLPGLPCAFGENSETLTLVLEDEVSGVEVTLFYTLFTDTDVIVRSTRIRNKADAPVWLVRALSACLELPEGPGRTLTFGGAWAYEHIPVYRKTGYGGTVSESRRGAPGHGGQPFMGLIYDRGDVFAMHLIYSGSYLAKLGENHWGDYRMVMGIHPDCFEWKLEAGEDFYTPEAVLVSAKDQDGMTHSLHDFYRRHLIRDIEKPRPILINNWEATYFDFDAEKILSIARAASKCGIEMFVLDDGWFGEGRMTPSGSLGDWTASRSKFPEGLQNIGKELAKLGLFFGLWFEPEMISEKSRLYEAHPDWVMCQNTREPGRCRDQWMLDLTNPDVRDYLFAQMASAIREGGIRYVKWDMNRTLTDVGSSCLPSDRQMEIMHRHVLGVYDIQERLLQEFPDLLIENCASGGARFDPGMLYYSPQIWCSDNMDPLERMRIHEGTAMLYPLSAIGSHVPKSTNDITGRTVPFASRVISAMFGTFGFELDITELTEDERKEICSQVDQYKKIWPLILHGDYYNLASCLDNEYWSAYEVVSKDALCGFVVFRQILTRPDGRSMRVLWKGLDAERDYDVGGTVYSGDALMKAGYLFPCIRQDFYLSMVEFHAL